MRRSACSAEEKEKKGNQAQVDCPSLKCFLQVVAFIAPEVYRAECEEAYYLPR